MPNRTLSLRLRLGGALSLLFLAGVLVLFTAARSYGGLVADRSYDRLLYGSALSISETISVRASKLYVDLPYAALDMLSVAPDDRVFYRILGPDGKLITGYGDLPLPSVIPSTPMTTHGDAPSFFTAKYRGEDVRFVLIGRQIMQPDMKGWIQVQVGQTRLARQSLAREALLGTLVPIGVMTILALIVAWIVVGVSLKPLERVRAELARRNPSDLSPVDANVPREIVPLIEAMNYFMVRLGQNIETLKGFIAEASHQMRTPLAALLAQAHVAQGEEKEGLKRGLEAVERNGSKLSHLLNQLLSDATVSHRSDIRSFHPVDLVELVEEVCASAVFMADDADVRFRTSLNSAQIPGDRLMLSEALKNLLDNALHHGRGEVRKIEVELVLEDGEYKLAISDRGKGIAIEDRERVFKRFTRGDSSHPGAGIGLAIVKNAIEAHEGTVTLQDRPGGGLTVLVKLGCPAS